MKALLFLLFLFPAFALAQSETVVINEVAWMGSPVEGVDAKQWWRYEWIELFNPSNQPLRIDGWSIELSRDKPDFVIPLAGIIPAEGYFIAASSDEIADADLNYQSLAGKFNNAGQLVVLKNAKGETVDLVDARSGLSAGEAGWPAGNNEGKYTMERAAGSESVSEEWQTSFIAGGTPGAKNSESKFLPGENRKDSVESFQSPNIFQKPFAIASLVAALVAVLAVFLRRRLALPPNRRA